MKKTIQYLAILTALCSWAGTALAGYSTGGSFAAPGYGARAWGMGGAVIAHAADEGSSYWNPALLSLLDKNRLGLTYVDLIPGTEAQQSYLAYAHVLKRGPAEEPGLEFAKLAVGVIYGNLGLELSDGQTYDENSLRLALAFSPHYFINFGIAFNMLFSSSDVESFGSRGTSLEGGLRVALLKNMAVGFVVRNALSQVDFDDDVSYSLPRSYVLGISYNVLDNLTVEGDAVSSFGGMSRLVIGGEWSLFANALFLRGGWSAVTAGETRNVPHVGLGIQLRQIRLDYNANFDTDEAFSNTHRFSLGIGL